MDELSFLYESIYRQLAGEITSGQRKPGEKLPTEQQLAAEHHVSRITSKRALNMLAERGLVTRRRGLGTFVASHASGAGDPFSASPPFQGQEASEQPKIGLIMEDLGESYALSLFYEIERRATALGYQIFLGISYGDQANEKEVLRKTLSLQLKGLLVMPAHGLYYNTDLLRLVLNHFPVVLIDRPLYGIPAPSVYSDNISAAFELTQSLIQKGHKHIVYISTDVNEAISLEDRYRGYEKAMNESALSPMMPFILPKLTRLLPPEGKPSLADSNEADSIASWLEEHKEVTAIIASEYGIAHLSRLVAQKLGRRIPEDLAICCFDAKYGYLGEYYFTHIKQDEASIARQALELMAAMLEGKNMRRQSRLVPATLRLGASS